jgi:glycosyltransferase involved in cell wall biosynthesis
LFRLIFQFSFRVEPTEVRPDMRIATFIPKLDACGGVELSSLQAASSLALRGHETILLYERPGNLSDKFAEACERLVPTPNLRVGQPPALMWNSTRTAWSLGALHPDVVYSHNLTEFRWTGMTKLLHRVPTVYHLHESSPFTTRSVSLLGRTADRFIVVSDFMRAHWVSHGLDPSKVTVVPNAINHDEYPTGGSSERARARASLGLPSDAYVVLYYGRIVPEKGVETLLDAWKHVRQQVANAHLVIMGGPAEDADEASKNYFSNLKAQCPEDCTWLSMRPDVLEALYAADVVVVPSVWDEPFGRVIIEAMSTGRPVVASEVGGIPEILSGPFSRFLFPRGDSEALSERLAGLAGWQAREPQLGDACVAHVESHYALGTMSGQIESVLAGVVKR